MMFSDTRGRGGSCWATGGAWWRSRAGRGALRRPPRPGWARRPPTGAGGSVAPRSAGRPRRCGPSRGGAPPHRPAARPSAGGPCRFRPAAGPAHPSLGPPDGGTAGRVDAARTAVFARRHRRSASLLARGARSHGTRVRRPAAPGPHVPTAHGFGLGGGRTGLGRVAAARRPGCRRRSARLTGRRAAAGGRRRCASGRVRHSGPPLSGAPGGRPRAPSGTPPASSVRARRRLRLSGLARRAARWDRPDGRRLSGGGPGGPLPGGAPPAPAARVGRPRDGLHGSHPSRWVAVTSLPADGTGWVHAPSGRVVRAHTPGVADVVVPAGGSTSVGRDLTESTRVRCRTVGWSRWRARRRDRPSGRARTGRRGRRSAGTVIARARSGRPRTGGRAPALRSPAPVAVEPSSS